MRKSEPRSAQTRRLAPAAARLEVKGLGSGQDCLPRQRPGVPSAGRLALPGLWERTGRLPAASPPGPPRPSSPSAPSLPLSPASWLGELKAPTDGRIQPPGRAASGSAQSPPSSGAGVCFSLHLISHFSRDKALCSQWGDTLEGRKRFPISEGTKVTRLRDSSEVSPPSSPSASLSTISGLGRWGVFWGVGSKNRLHVYSQTSCLQWHFTGDYCAEIHPTLTSWVLHSTPTPASFCWQATEPKRPRQGKPGSSTVLIHPINPLEYTKQCPTPGPQPHPTAIPGAGPIAGRAGLGAHCGPWYHLLQRHPHLPGSRRRPGWCERRVLSNLSFLSASQRSPSLGLREPGLSEV